MSPLMLYFAGNAVILGVFSLSWNWFVSGDHDESEREWVERHSALFAVSILILGIPVVISSLVHVLREASRSEP